MDVCAVAKSFEGLTGAKSQLMANKAAQLLMHVGERISSEARERLLIYELRAGMRDVARRHHRGMRKVRK